jgi:peptidoglycan hydrolase-like protein with peptidoglycan-binding domain
MPLADRLAASDDLPLSVLSKEEAKEVQQRLTEIGLLDPPPDGAFGQVSRWALAAFCKAAGLGAAEPITARIWQRLSSPEAAGLFPLDDSGSDFASRVIRAMRARGDFVVRHPDAVNIVYVEGCGPTGVENDDAPNKFNDCRLAIRIGTGGKPFLAGSWEATTEPGRYWTVNPMNAKGAARIAFGQYKAWSKGEHRKDHEALVQTGTITVHRDLNKDYKRTGDALDPGDSFAVNQHWGYDRPKEDIGRASAGCLVGRTMEGHREFMEIVKNDPRFKANNGYRFMTSVLPESAVRA